MRPSHEPGDRRTHGTGASFLAARGRRESGEASQVGLAERTQSSCRARAPRRYHHLISGAYGRPTGDDRIGDPIQCENSVVDERCARG